MTSLWANNVYFLFAFSILCWSFLPSNKLWNNTAVALLFFSVLYLQIQLINGNQVDSRFIQGAYLLTPAAFYRFGRFIFIQYRSDYHRQLILFIILSLYLMPLFLATFKDIALVGLVNETRQLLADISGKKDSLAATLYGLMASVGIGCISTLFIRKQSMLFKFLFLLIASLCLLSVVHLVNRTGLVICMASLLAGFFASTKVKITRILPALFLLVLLVVVLLSSGIISQDMIDAYSARENDSSSDASSAGGRTELWLNAINNLFTRPFGWELEHFSHNLWLDIARISGIFALIPFIYATYRFVLDWIKVFKFNKSVIGYLLLCINLAIMLNAAVEPVIEGSMLFFSMTMLFWGMLKQVALESNSKIY